MEPLEWILGIMLFISGGANWIQAEKIDNKAEQVRELSTDLLVAKKEIAKRDGKLIEAEVIHTSSRRRLGRSLQQQSFIIYSQARQLQAVNPDTPHNIHRKTTKDFNDIVGIPDSIPSDNTVWNSSYLSKSKAELIKAKALEAVALEEVADLRKKLRRATEKQNEMLNTLDRKTLELTDLTGKNAGLLNKLGSYTVYGVWAGIVFGILYLWSIGRGLWFKHVQNKYKSAMETFSMLGEEGNDMAANVLADMKLQVPRSLIAYVLRQKLNGMKGTDYQPEGKSSASRYRDTDYDSISPTGAAQ